MIWYDKRMLSAGMTASLELVDLEALDESYYILLFQDWKATGRLYNQIMTTGRLGVNIAITALLPNCPSFKVFLTPETFRKPTGNPVSLKQPSLCKRTTRTATGVFPGKGDFGEMTAIVKASWPNAAWKRCILPDISWLYIVYKMHVLYIPGSNEKLTSSGGKKDCQRSFLRPTLEMHRNTILRIFHWILKALFVSF